MGFAFQLNEFIDLGKLLICASAVSYINRDSSHPPKRMTEDYNELISQSFMPSLSLSLTHTQTHTHTHTHTDTHTHTPVVCIQSVQLSCSVVSDSLRLHGLQYARLPCPSPTPRDYSNSCPLSQMPSNHHILCWVIWHLYFQFLKGFPYCSS